MSTQKLITGILLGTSVGLLVGILFAPDKGSETRKKISRKSSDLAESVKDKFNDFIDSVADKFSKAKDEVVDDAVELYENGRHKVSKIKQETDKALS